MSAAAAGQAWDAEGYVTNAGFVADLGAAALESLAPARGEVVLDLGCGDGRLTEKIVAAGAAVTGLEPDASMAAAARARGIDVIEQDAHAPFGTARFDAVFSNAALHWMRDPARVLANVHDALASGGRFVAEQGGFGNCAAFVTAIRAALEARGHAVAFEWDFPSSTKQAARLRRAGFAVKTISLVPRPTQLPTGMEGWLSVFAGPYLGALPEAERGAVLDDTLRRLRYVLHDTEEGWIADYVRLRFVAVKPGLARS